MDDRDVACAWADLSDAEKKTLIEARAIAQRSKVPLVALANYAHRFHQWVLKTDRHHLAECVNPECDADICRQARGLPPYSEVDIEQMHLEAMKQRQERREQITKQAQLIKRRNKQCRA